MHITHITFVHTLHAPLCHAHIRLLLAHIPCDVQAFRDMVRAGYIHREREEEHDDDPDLHPMPEAEEARERSSKRQRVGVEIAPRPFRGQPAFGELGCVA